jgi:type II secretory pathway component GspD/PulD (secretin)
MKKNKFCIILSVILSFTLIILLNSCAYNSKKIKGISDLNKIGDYDKKLEHCKKLAIKYPESMEIKTLLFKAKLNSYYYHLSLARNFKETEKKDKAIDQYKIALNLFPNNKKLKGEFDSYLNPQKVKKQKIFKSTIKSPVKLNIDTKEKISLDLRSTPITKIFKIFGRSYNINVLFDKDFRDFVYSIEIKKIGFYEFLDQLCLISNATYRIVDSSSILIYSNTTFKKRYFGLRGIKVFYLSNIKTEDAKKLVITVFRDQQVMVQDDPNLNTLIIKASDRTLKDIERFLSQIDKENSEVVIDVEILEINRNLLRKIGSDFGVNPLAFSIGNEGEEGSINSTINLNQINDLNFFMTIPTIAMNFLETDDNNKILAKPNLRGINGQEIKFMVGDEIPIPQTQWQAMAAGGINNTPVTSYNYKNVGIELKLTPFIHANNEVTLKMKITMNFVSAYVNEFPVLGKRELECVIRLKEGETNIIGGFIRDEVRGSLNGIPFMSKIPILGRLFGNSEKKIKQTDLIFSITPRVIRKIDLDGSDLDPIWENLNTNVESSSKPSANPLSPVLSKSRRNNVNLLIISPSRKRVTINKDSLFTIRMNSNSEISSLSIGGTVSGSKAVIDEVRTDFFESDNVKILKNYSGNSFDLGYSFLGKPVKRSILAQIKIKFSEKGKYIFTINSINAYSKDRKQITIESSPAEIEVY